MHPEMEEIRCSIVRGGTSKGIFLMENDLPKDEEKRAKVIRAIFGSPDIRQIDGLGGADVLTSKLAIVGPPTVEGADVDYTFGQVSFVDDTIDFSGNCGNISSAVGPFAIDAGLVNACEPITFVRIHLTNSHRIITAEVPVKDGRACVEGDYAIDGVPGTGSKITMDWTNITGAFTGSLLPTGNPKDIIETPVGWYEVSLVDAGNPLVFIRAGELGLKGTESPAEIENDGELMENIEKIRGVAAEIFGLVDKGECAREKSPYNPFFAIISPPADYHTISGEIVRERDSDIVARLLFMQHMHKTYPVTGTVCTGAAARIPGSIVWEALSEESRINGKLRIGHPAGVIQVEAESETYGGKVKITRLGVYRTARKIMDGVVYIKRSVFR